MNEAVFLYGPRDVRVAPFNLREGRSGETLVDVCLRQRRAPGPNLPTARRRMVVLGY
jgi:hypothetical protein